MLTVMQALALAAAPSVAKADTGNCGATGWCCTPYAGCTTKVCCCYFENDKLQTGTCGCSGYQT